MTDELSVQIALGSVTDPSKIAKLVKTCKDPKVLVWALNHSNCRVRAAAAKNHATPINWIILRKLVEATSMVMWELDVVMHDRQNEVAVILNVIKELPQYPLPFSYDKKK